MLKFGTDGVRGEFGTELTESYAASLALAVVEIMACTKVVIGRDTRESGLALETAIAGALTAHGVGVQLMGMVPTPAIAFVAAQHDILAIAITASHNLFQDNGIKIFGAGGRKLSEQEQDRIEQRLTSGIVTESRVAGVGLSIGSKMHEEFLQEYCDFIVGLSRPDSLKNLHIALDCANGAFSNIAPEVFAKLGATVTTINATPDGRNINLNCGATHPQALGEVVKSVGAHFGVAFDGDGDRLIAVDGDGEVIDGDHLLAMSAIEMKRQNILRNNKVVVTVMTNIGFHQSMKKAGIDVVTTPVGDRSVLVALEENLAVLGGEQSGHIIYRNLATTGDGLLAALKLAELLVTSGKSLTEIASQAMTSYPQVLLNLRVSKRVENIEQLFAGEIATAVKLLDDDGRVLVRASGTEPVVRVMVEASKQSIAEDVATTLAEAITARLG